MEAARLGEILGRIVGTVLCKIIVEVNTTTETSKVLCSKQETVRPSGQPKSGQLSIKSASVTLGNYLSS